MPTPAAILESLTRIANDLRPLAALWHVLLGAALLALLVGVRPSRRAAALLLTVPLISVGLVALLFRNHFNALVMLAAALALVVLGLRLPREAVKLGSPPAQFAALALIAFGWVYPHFFPSGSAWLYVYAAPLGLLPCPTLAVVLGFALLVDGLGARAWPTILAGLGLFYGLFGTVRLGVTLDIGLLLGAAALFAAAHLRDVPGERSIIKGQS